MAGVTSLLEKYPAIVGPALDGMDGVTDHFIRLFKSYKESGSSPEELEKLYQTAGVK